MRISELGGMEVIKSGPAFVDDSDDFGSQRQVNHAGSRHGRSEPSNYAMVNNTVHQLEDPRVEPKDDERRIRFAADEGRKRMEGRNEGRQAKPKHSLTTTMLS